VETLEEAQARVSELEAQVASLAGERDAAVNLGEQLRVQLGETAGQRDAATAELTAAQTTASEAQAAASEASAAVLAATRRALLAEYAGQVVPELVVGETVEALEASVEGARTAFTRAAEAARTAGAPAVPAGAGSARATVPTSGMSPLEMIATGLGQRGGR
jgi:chromosome segregation ATPase